MTRLGRAAGAAIQGAGEVCVADAAGNRATLRVRDADRLAVTLDGITVHAPADPVARAGGLARDLRPGGERLRAEEVDARLGGATLRTRPGDMRAGRFFEVVVRPEGVGLRRHRVDADGRRATEPFTLTREQLGRLVDTLAADPDAD